MVGKVRNNTRGKLLDAAEKLVNHQGFSATSIDQINAAVGVTKGTFFYHFKTKQDLARALIDRFAAADGELLRSNMERAEKLSEDPLQQVLIFTGLMLEVAERLDSTTQPGCLYATYCFESGLFSDETKAVTAGAILKWRSALSEKLRAIVKMHPPRKPVDIESLADMLTTLFEGAFVLARTLEEKSTFRDQVQHYRTYLKLLFDPS